MSKMTLSFFYYCNSRNIHGCWEQFQFVNKHGLGAKLHLLNLQSLASCGPKWKNSFREMGIIWYTLFSATFANYKLWAQCLWLSLFFCFFIWILVGSVTFKISIRTIYEPFGIIFVVKPVAFHPRSRSINHSLTNTSTPFAILLRFFLLVACY